MLLSCHASRFPAAPQSWLWQGKLEEAIGQWRDAKAQKEVPSCCALLGLWQGSGFCGMAAVAWLLWLMHAVYNRRVLTVRWGQVKGLALVLTMSGGGSCKVPRARSLSMS